MIIGFHHVSVPARDIGESARFYQSVLGFKEVARPANLANNGIWLEGYGFQVHLIEDSFYQGSGLGDGTLPDKRHFAFSVSDALRFHTYLDEKGVMLSNPIPLCDSAQQFFFLDPSGTPIEVNDLASQSDRP